MLATVATHFTTKPSMTEEFLELVLDYSLQIPRETRNLLKVVFDVVLYTLVCSPTKYNNDNILKRSDEKTSIELARV